MVWRRYGHCQDDDYDAGDEGSDYPRSIFAPSPLRESGNVEKTEALFCETISLKEMLCCAKEILYPAVRIPSPEEF